MNKNNYQTSLTKISDVRLPKKQGKKFHFVFNAECDDLPFTIFSEMPGFQICRKMIQLGIQSCKCEIKWKEFNEYYNRCIGIIFPVDFEKMIEKNMRRV